MRARLWKACLQPVLVVCVLGFAGAACACIHLSHGGTGSVASQAAQRAVVFHANGEEELLLEVDLRLLGSGALPDSLGWVLTLPSKPSNYSTDVPANFFLQGREVYRPLATLEESRITRWNSSSPQARSYSYGGGQARSAPPPIEVTFRKVGRYDIHEIAVTGDDAVSAVNFWLNEHDFEALPLDRLKYFVDRKQTFLCIRTDLRPEASTAASAPPSSPKVLTPQYQIPGSTPKQDPVFRPRSTVQTTTGWGTPPAGNPRDVRLAPLRIRFSTPEVFYPLNFSTSRGAFAVDLLIFTDRPVDWDAAEVSGGQMGASLAPEFSMTDGDSRYRLRRTVELSDEQAANLQTLSTLVTDSTRGKSGRQWYASRVFAPAVNSSVNPISSWTQDIVFPLQSDGATAGRLNASPFPATASVEDAATVKSSVEQLRELRVLVDATSTSSAEPPAAPPEEPQEPAAPPSSGGNTDPDGLNLTLSLTLPNSACLPNGELDPKLHSILAALPVAAALSVDARGTGLGDAGLLQLAECRGIVGLNLSGTAITTAALPIVAKLPRLRSLNLAATRAVSRNGLEALQSALQLDELDVRQTGLTDEGIVAVARIPNLMQLDVGYNDISADGLAPLGDRKRYERLGITGTAVTSQTQASLVVQHGFGNWSGGWNAVDDSGWQNDSGWQSSGTRSSGKWSVAPPLSNAPTPPAP
ncbi:MAG: hypothetical protein KDA75_01330 [Planctomycetaceae bacterium]|nr:hypothetical protein [Planctomycetaceae bacterium]